MSNHVREIPLDKIFVNSNQPRKKFDEDSLRELANSIEKQGILQAILVRPMESDMFELVCGERRFRACKMLGLKTIKAEIRELNDSQILEVQLVENLQRENLNPFEEAKIFRRMVSELGYTHEEIGEKIAKSREFVTKRLRLLNLPLDLLEKINAGKLSVSQAEIILSTEDKSLQKQIAEKILRANLTVKQAKELLNNMPNSEADVLRGTSENYKDSQIVKVEVSGKAIDRLIDLAYSNRSTIPKLCSEIIEREVLKND